MEVYSAFTGSISFFYIFLLFAFFLLYWVLSFIIFALFNAFFKTKIKLTKILKGSLILGLVSSICYRISLFPQKFYESNSQTYEPSYLPFIITFMLGTIIFSFLISKYVYGKILKRIYHFLIVLVLLVVITTPCILVIYGNISL